MMINEQKISYKISSGKIFEHIRKTTDWAEAKELLKEIIAKSKKTAYWTVLYGDIPIGVFDITNYSTVEKPKLEIGLKYDDLIKKAIKNQNVRVLL